MRNLLTALFLCFAILLGIAESASGASTVHGSKTASGDFWENPNICTYKLGSLELEPCRGDTIVGYDSATGVLYYVRQNPWSKFDPLGLDSNWHHKFSQKHEDFFNKIGIDIHSPEHGVLLDVKDHNKIHDKTGFKSGTDAYTQEWDNFVKDQIDEFGTDFDEKSAKTIRKNAQAKLHSLETDSRFSKHLSKGHLVPRGISYGTYSAMSSADKGAFYRGALDPTYKKSWSVGAGANPNLRYAGTRTLPSGRGKALRTLGFVGEAAKGGFKLFSRAAKPVMLFTLAHTASTQGLDAAGRQALMEGSGAWATEIGARKISDSFYRNFGAQNNFQLQQIGMPPTMVPYDQVFGKDAKPLTFEGTGQSIFFK